MFSDSSAVARLGDAFLYTMLGHVKHRKYVTILSDALACAVYTLFGLVQKQERGDSYLLGGLGQGADPLCVNHGRMRQLLKDRMMIQY